MYSRAEYTEQISSPHQDTRLIVSQTSSDMVSPVSEDGMYYHEEPSPVPEPTLPEDFRADEMAYEKMDADDQELSYEKISFEEYRGDSFEDKPTVDISSEGDMYATPEQSFDNSGKRSGTVSDSQREDEEEINKYTSNFSKEIEQQEYLDEQQQAYLDEQQQEYFDVQQQEYLDEEQENLYEQVQYGVESTALDDFDSAVDSTAGPSGTLNVKVTGKLEAPTYDTAFFSGSGPEIGTSVLVERPGTLSTDLTASLGEEDFVDRREEELEQPQRQTLSRQQTPEQAFSFKVPYLSSGFSSDAERSLEGTCHLSLLSIIFGLSLVPVVQSVWCLALCMSAQFFFASLLLVHMVLFSLLTIDIAL